MVVVMSQHPELHASGTNHGDSSPPASSGAVTPLTGSPSSSFMLSSSVSTLWGGLMRRFSSDAAVSGSTASTSAPSTFHQPHLHHSGSGSSSSHYHDASHGSEELHGSSRLRDFEAMRPPPLEPLALRGFKDDEATPDAQLLDTAVAEEIRIMVPTRLALVDEWNLVYSLYQDGASLATLFEKCAAYEGQRVGFVLVVRDLEGGVFGAYLSDFPHPAPKYFGTGECFLWRASVLASLPPPPSADTTNLSRTSTLKSPTRATADDDGLLSEEGPSIRFKAFPYSGVNDYCMLCEAGFLSLGAGDGKYGLWLDDSLVRGVSSMCMTFGNEPLSDQGEKFDILGVELWVVGGGPAS